MDNFELHEEATRLADSHSPYMLAKMLLIEQKERIELAAHVERLREDVYDQANTILGEFGVRETIDDYLPDSYNETPATSLARRDLTKQAEALESARIDFEDCYPAADSYVMACDVSEGLFKCSKRLRQQAKETN